MRVATVRMKFNRATGEKLEEKIVEYKDVDDDKYWRPIVEFMAPRFQEWLKQQRKEVREDA